MKPPKHNLKSHMAIKTRKKKKKRRDNKQKDGKQDKEN